ncbi:MAG: UDP-N-acetylglucosamine 1-carboxyvinyltransferase [Lachnospiraceae bacterium]|nr:UDP-N-acetylglucosamine 1-carboxyvinyltransferase [Lachnospiraceae bacterium]
MNRYIINGGKSLHGDVVIGGAKNAALGIIAGAILTDEPVTIENLPDVSDINVLLDAIKGIGATVDRIDPHKVVICGKTINSVVVKSEVIQKIRASYYLLGALIGKKGQAQVAMPGGCDIGSRPIDQHLKGFRALGVNCDENEKDNCIYANVTNLRGNGIFLDVASVGATINIMLAAVLAKGQTTVENAAKEPHIVDVANFLNSMGARIKGAGTDVIRIYGVESLRGTEYSIIPDQIEAGTFMCAVAAAKGDVTLKNVIPRHLEAISSKLEEIGVRVEESASGDEVRIVAEEGTRLGSSTVRTRVYPGFPTDMQPQITSVLMLGSGNSTVTETIFENRFRYVEELRKMGADIDVKDNKTAKIHGVESVTGTHIEVPDLRAGAALTIAALAAGGQTVLDWIDYIERGYEDFDGKLRGIGADIVKETVDDRSNLGTE